MTTEEMLLDRLFRPTREVSVAGRCLTIRALSGPEQETRSLYATNQARKLEKELADTESDLYQYRIRPLDDLEESDLRLLLKNGKEFELQRQAADDHRPVFIPFPDEATEDERKKVLDDREAAEAKRQEQISQQVADGLAKYLASLEGKTLEELLVLARKRSIKTAVDERANMAYAHATLYAATYADGSRYFSGADEVAAMPREVIFHLYRLAQEVNNVDPLALKSNGPSSTG